jgi:hypothetical protein
MSSRRRWYWLIFFPLIGAVIAAVWWYRGLLQSVMLQ